MNKLAATANNLRRGFGVWDISTDRLIISARALLAAVALLAIYLDPTQPSRFAEFAYYVLASYLALALLVVALAWAGKEMPALSIALHFVDLGVCGTVLYLTEGPSSPFFVFFTFVLLAATLRWDWPGVTATAAGLILLFVIVSVATETGVSGPIEDLNLRMMRVTYLVVVGAMLTFVGGHRMHVRRRIKSLASWPPEHPTTFKDPPLEQSLKHAVEVMQAKGALVIWEASEEPYTCSAAMIEGRYRTRVFSGISWQPAASELATNSFVVRSGGVHSAVIETMLDPLKEPSDDAILDQNFTYEVVAIAPFSDEKFQGLVLLFDPQPLDHDLLIELADIVARRIGIEIEHYFLRAELEDMVIERERARLAQDIHDDVLQTFTAARLQLNAIAESQAGETRESLDKVSALLMLQQRRIRLILSPGFKRMAGANNPTRVEACLRTTLSDIKEQWDCDVTLKVVPADALIPSNLCGDLAFLLLESAANAVRHGKARSIDVAAERAPGSLALRIRDDGAGFAALRGTFDHEQIAAHKIKPASMYHRVDSLGGRMTLVTSGDGTEIRVDLRLP